MTAFLRNIPTLSLALLTGCSPLIRRMAFFPEVTLQSAKLRLPSGVKEVYIHTADGKRLQCFLVEHTSSKKLVIYFHGNAGNIYERIPELAHIAQAGASVLGVGYRGYGKSTGRPSEAGIYKDGDAALAYALDSLGYDVSCVFIFGRSIGTTAAAHVGAKKGLAGVILVTPLTTGRDHARAHGLGSISFLAGDAFNVRDMVTRITSPILVIHGTHDEVIPYSMGEQVFASAHEPKRFTVIDRGQHNDLEFVDSVTFWGAVGEFVAGCGNP